MKKNIKIEQAAGNGQEATEQEVGSRDLFPTGWDLLPSSHGGAVECYKTAECSRWPVLQIAAKLTAHQFTQGLGKDFLI